MTKSNRVAVNSPPNYSNGFAPRDGQPLYPSLWRGCVGAWAPGLGPSGLTLRDWSGRNRHSILNNVDPSACWSVDEKQYSLRLDGVNDFLSFPSLVQPLPLSLSFWIRPASLGSDRRLFSASAGTGTQFAMRLDTSVGSQLQVINAAGSAWLTLATGITAGTLIHVAVNAGTTSTQAWINGVENAAVGASVGMIDNRSFGSPYLSFGSFYAGHVGDMQLRNRLLTASEIPLLARRPGIAYDLAARRRSSVQVAGGFKAAWIPRRSLVIGGGTN